MYRFLSFTVYLLTYIAFGDAASVSFIKPCKSDDHACILASTIAAMPHLLKGISDLGIESSDPIILNDVRADAGDLQLGFRNLHLKGISKCKVLKSSRDLEKSTINLSLECPIDVTGQYDLDGKILFIPAEGNGDFRIVTNKVKIDGILNIVTVERDGEKYWKINDFDYKYDIIAKATIDLENLFGGDEARAKPIKQILNHSWKELITELGAPIIKELFTKEVNIVQKLFDKMPVSKLELS